jgi:hypothetical protein
LYVGYGGLPSGFSWVRAVSTLHTHFAKAQAKTSATTHQTWLDYTPIISATQEVEIRRITV